MKLFAGLISTTAIVSQRSAVPWACIMRPSAVLRILRMLCEAQDKFRLQSTPFDLPSVSIRAVLILVL